WACRLAGPNGTGLRLLQADLQGNGASRDCRLMLSSRTAYSGAGQPMLYLCDASEVTWCMRLALTTPGRIDDCHVAQRSRSPSACQRQSIERAPAPAECIHLLRDEKVDEDPVYFFVAIRDGEIVRRQTFQSVDKSLLITRYCPNRVLVVLPT